MQPRLYLAAITPTAFSQPATSSAPPACCREPERRPLLAPLTPAHTARYLAPVRHWLCSCQRLAAGRR